MVLRVGNDKKLIGGDFFPPGMGLQLLKNVPKTRMFFNNYKKTIIISENPIFGY